MKIEGKDRLVLLYTFGFAIDLFGLMILYNFLGIQKDFYLPIKYLSLEIIPELNTNIISQYKYLETLSVDRKESKQWEKELNDLKKNGMRILLNDIYYF